MPFSYDAVGETHTGRAPEGFDRDHNRERLGIGAAAFAAAYGALRGWKMLWDCTFTPGGGIGSRRGWWLVRRKIFAFAARRDKRSAIARRSAGIRGRGTDSATSACMKITTVAGAQV